MDTCHNHISVVTIETLLDAKDKFYGLIFGNGCSDKSLVAEVFWGVGIFQWRFVPCLKLFNHFSQFFFSSPGYTLPVVVLFEVLRRRIGLSGVILTSV